MDVKEQKVNVNGVQDLGTNPQDLVIGDPIVYHLDRNRMVGKVSNVFLDNQVTKVELELRDKSKHIVKANDSYLQALFMKNPETGKKTYTRFSYQEVIDLVNKNQFNGLKYDDLGKSSVINLMLGGKTKLIDNIQLTKKATEEETSQTFVKSGRYTVYESNGKLKVNLELKARELNLDNPVFGLLLTAAQKKQLEKTGELGLVEGFVNTQTGEVTNKWVSVDKRLNSVVTRPENSVYIDKMYGEALTEKQKEALKKGEGILLEFTKKDKTKFKQFIQVSAASTNYNGLRSFSEKKAKELKLIPSKEPSTTKKKSSGLKI